MNGFSYGIYPVISEDFCKGLKSLFVLEEILKGGAKIVQLREKHLSKKELYELAISYRKLTNEYNATLIINDHLDIALSVNANGVHLGQDDLPLIAARKIAPNMIIGISTHNKKEALMAEEGGATYINIGPIYKTKTKTLSSPHLTPQILNEIKPKIPFSVMGGIKEHHIPELISFGVKNIAMVTEITQATDIQAKVRQLMQIMQSS